MGYAAGYILGGIIAPALGWRAAFLLEAVAMLPFAVFCAVGPALDLRGKEHHTGIYQDLHPLYKHDSVARQEQPDLASNLQPAKL